MYLLVAAVAGAGFAFAVPAVVPTAEASVTSALTWGDCPQFAAGVPVDPRQQCGTVRVPLDYRQPHGRSITVAVSRIPAADPGRRLSCGNHWPEARADAIPWRRFAGVAKLVDARDLTSLGPKGLCRFKSGRPHQLHQTLIQNSAPRFNPFK